MPVASQSYRERTAGTITSTKLEDFNFCQMLYKLKWIDGVNAADEEEEDQSAEALVIGTAYDVYMQSVQKFNEEYAVVGTRGKGGNPGKIELTMAQGKLIRAMAAEIVRQPFYSPTGEKQYHLKVQLNDTITVSCTIDEFQENEMIIADDKTSAGLERFQRYRDKYKRQLAFYQWVVWMALVLLCKGVIRMVTKDKVPKSVFYDISAEDLKKEWKHIIRSLEELEDCIKADYFERSPREKCLTCPAYASCPSSIQTEYVPL